MNRFVGAVLGPFTVAGAAARTLGRTILYGRGRNWGVLLSRSRIDYRSEIGDPATNSVVGAVVGWIARNLPEAPVRIVVEGTTEVAHKSGPTGPGAMLRLLTRPNEFYSGSLQWKATLVDYYCRGNAYWLKQRSDGGRVIALWWVPESMMEPKWPDNDPTVFIGWYEYRVDGEIYYVRPGDVVHFRNGLDPNNPRKGLSALASLFREIFTDDEASNFSASLLRNLGVPGVVISPSNTGGPVGKADPEAVKTSFMEKFGGDKRGEPLVLTAPTDVKVLSFNPQQMELRELRRIPEERISANLGVPASVAGLGAGLDQNAFTSYGEANVAAYTQGVIPTQGGLASDLDMQLLPEFCSSEEQVASLDVWFDWTGVAAMRSHAASVWKQLEASASKGLITRKAFKLGTGQEVLPGDDVYLVANNILAMPAGGVAPPGQAPVNRPTIVPDDQAAVDEPPELAAAAASGPVKCTTCDRLLAEQATAPYRFTCRGCKTVVEATAPVPTLRVVAGERFEYDADSRVVAIYDVSA